MTPVHRRPTDGSPSVGRVYLLLAGVFGVAIIAVTPPMQVPDETAHFLRAAAVARGQLVAEPTAAGPGGTLPSSLVELTAGPWGALRGRPEASITVREVTSQLTHRPPVEAEVMVPFPESSRWSPVATLPQSLALLLARALGLPPLLHYLLGRLAGLAAWTGLVWLSLRVAPGFRWTLALLALTPMSLFLAGSHSPDVMTNALSLLLLALALRSTASLDPLGGREAALLLSTAGLLMLTKPYLPLLLLLWLVPRARLGGRPRTTAWRLGGPLLCLLPAALWHLANAGVSPPLPPGTEPAGQLAWLMQHPVEAVALVVRSTLHQSLTWAHQLIGVLGWLDTRLPRPWCSPRPCCWSLFRSSTGPARPAHPRTPRPPRRCLRRNGARPGSAGLPPLDAGGGCGGPGSPGTVLHSDRAAGPPPHRRPRR